MKTVDNALKSAFNQSSLTICWCWLITRVDGVKLGFTSLDVAFEIDEVHYTPFSGFDPGAAQQSLGADSIDSQRLQGILDNSGISKKDLASGVYEYAKVKIFLINYEDIPTSLSLSPPKHLELPPGHLAESKRNSLGYEINVKDDLEYLNNNIVEETSKICRANLGDDRCRKDLSEFTYNFAIAEVESKRVFSININLPNKWLDFGRIYFNSGENNGLYRDVGFSLNNKIILSPIPAPFNLKVGDTGIAIAGCRKTKLDCVTKFQNFQNFIGEPDVPTTDIALENPSK